MVNAVRRLPQIPQVGAGQSTQESSSTTGGLFSKLFRKSGNNPNLTEQQIQQQQLQLQQQRLLAQQQLQQQQRGLQSSLSQPQGLASLAGGLAGGGRAGGLAGGGLAGGLAGGGLAGGLAGQQQLLAQQQQLLQQGGLQVQIGFLLHAFSRQFKRPWDDNLFRLVEADSYSSSRVSQELLLPSPKLTCFSTSSSSSKEGCPLVHLRIPSRCRTSTGA